MRSAKLSPPWVSFYRKLCALFAKDPDVSIDFDEDALEVKLKVDGADKADALSQLLPCKKPFGNVTLTITVIPSNKIGARKIDLFSKAFDGNRAVSEIITLTNEYGDKNDFVVFDSEVVQFFNDDISDVYGNCSTLYQDIAREVFDGSGVFFCTENILEK